MLTSVLFMTFLFFLVYIPIVYDSFQSKRTYKRVEIKITYQLYFFFLEHLIETKITYDQIKENDQVLF